MMFGEFLELAKLTGTEENYNMYTNDIEPAYMNMPGGFDKKTFVKWWENNKDICKWISHIVTENETIQKELKEATEQKEELEAESTKLHVRINGLEQDVEGMQRGKEEREAYWKEQLDSVQLKANEELLMLKVRVLFGKEEELKNELKIAMFDNYESIKKFAEEKGII